MANQGDCVSAGTVTVIDGATNSTTTVAAGTNPYAVARQPGAQPDLLVPNIISNNVAVLAEQEVQDIPLRASTTPLADNQTTTSTLTVTFTTASTFSPIAPPVESC